MTCAQSRKGYDKENELTCSNYKCFKFLLNLNDKNKTRANINQRYCTTNSSPGSVMIECVKLKKIECVKLLIDYSRKYNINFKNDASPSLNANALMIAMSLENNEKMIRLLIKNIDLFDVNYQSSKGGSVLIYPVATRGCSSFSKHFIMDCDYKKYLDILFDEMSKKQSIASTIDPTIVDTRNRSLFEILVSDSKDVACAQLINYFIEQGRDKCGWNIKQLIGDYRNSYNETLYHIAARRSSLVCLKLLLKLKFLDDINIIGGKNDDTLLNMCIESINRYEEVTYKSSVNFKVFELLLSQPGINPNVSNKFGHNAFDMCRRRGKFQYLEILNEWKERE